MGGTQKVGEVLELGSEGSPWLLCGHRLQGSKAGSQEPSRSKAWTREVAMEMERRGTSLGTLQDRCKVGHL